jgi:hypothetical protein
MSNEFITQEDFDRMLDSKLEALLGKMGENVTRQLEAHTARIGEVVKGGSSSYLDQLIEEADAIEDDEDDDDDDDEFDYSDDEEDAPTVTRDPEVAKLKRELDTLKQQSQNDRTAREEAEFQKAQAALDNATIETLSKSGIGNARQLLTLLKSEGKIVEKDGQYVVASKDQYGDTFTPVADKLPEFLAGDYGHFAPARPGTGTGATAAGSNSMMGGSLKYFNSDGSAKGNIGEAMAKDRSGYLAELSQVQAK